MHRLPWWKRIIMILAVLFGVVYSLPNLFGELPAVQVSSARPTVKVVPADAERLQSALTAAGITPVDIRFESLGAGGGTLRARFTTTDDQLKARDAIEQALQQPDETRYVVAPGLVSSVPGWMASLRALPMYLGLDLRGGVHFLLQVDLDSAVTKRLDSLQAEARTLLRGEKIRFRGVMRSERALDIRFSDNEQRAKGLTFLRTRLEGLEFESLDLPGSSPTAPAQFILRAGLSEAGIAEIQKQAVQQNVLTLGNRINELGVAEPIVQQQGADRIVVQLPGVQDTAKAKDILGRTASLEVRLVEDSPAALAAAAGGVVPETLELLTDTDGQPLLVRREVMLTGERLNDAQAGFSGDNAAEPAVHLTLDSVGARIFRDVTRENVGRRMAILLIDRGVSEVVTAPVIRSEIPGGRVQISGSMNSAEAADIALLLRAGSLAAPMTIIEERLIGPSLGAENISQGFNATLWGFVVIAVFMVVYYTLFGVFSVLALTLNLLLLFSLLSLLQATLTLPGIAAIALTLGMAIDSNVLINERIREELEAGASPIMAIQTGYDRAWATILDSNITTLIAGIALLVFGSGPVRGFAVVHVLGILTSMFSAVFFSRGIAQLWHGGRKIRRLMIG